MIAALILKKIMRKIKKKLQN